MCDTSQIHQIKIVFFSLNTPVPIRSRGIFKIVLWFENKNKFSVAFLSNNKLFSRWGKISIFWIMKCDATAIKSVSIRTYRSTSIQAINILKLSFSGQSCSETPIHRNVNFRTSIERSKALDLVMPFSIQKFKKQINQNYTWEKPTSL